MKTKRKIIAKTPKLNSSIVKRPIRSRHTAEPAYPQISNVRLPNIRTVKMLTNEAKKLTELRIIVAVRGFKVSSPKTDLKIWVEKRVIA